MKIKSLFLIILMVSLMSGMIACSSSVSKNADGKAEVVWWVPENEQKAMLQSIADEFNKQHDDIVVKMQAHAGGDYYTKIQTVLAANNGPDVMWMNGPNFPKFQSKGFFLSYSDYIKKDKYSMDNYPKSLVDLYSADGKAYGMPKDYDTIGLFYNKELFDKAGVKYPDESWTWDDLRSAAKKLTKDGQWGIAAHASTQEVIYPFMVQNGVKPVEDDKKSTKQDSPEAIEAIQFLYDLMYTDKSSPDGQYMTDNNPTQLFQSGKVAMIMSGSWMAKPYYEAMKDKVDVAELPQKKKDGNIIHGIGWVTNAKTKNPDAVWEFIKWLGSKEVALMQAESGTVIPAFNGTAESWVKALPMNLKIFIDSTKVAVPYPSTPDAQWETPVFTHTTNIWLNKVKPEEGMKAVAKEANAVLDSIGK
jgi:multiple sugar transport system substrate-binding protein